MTIEPLFEEGPQMPVTQHCTHCQIPFLASDDKLRIRGWLVYDGVSVTGRPLHIRTCPPCQAREAGDMEKARRGEDPCTQIPLL